MVEKRKSPAKDRGKPVAPGLITMFGHRPLRTRPVALHGLMQNFDAPPPMFDHNKFQTEQQNAVAQSNVLLAMLNYYVRCFEADVQLYEFSAEQNTKARLSFEGDPSDKNADATLELMDGWPVIAARDGALSIYHFRRTIDGIDETLARTPSLAGMVDAAARKSARKMFQAAFPDFTNVRDAVAHSGDKSRTKDKREEHAFRGEWQNSQMAFLHGDGTPIEVTLVDVLNNRQYSNTWEGRVISYEISLASLEKLAAIRGEVYRAFQPLVPMLPDDLVSIRPV
jgi:hypothetical protein